MSLWWSIINRPTAGETRRAMLVQMRRANDLKEREVRAFEADANLIAAAALLAAAKKVCAEAGPDMSPSLGSLAELDAAIAKAEGRDV